MSNHATRAANTTLVIVAALVVGLAAAAPACGQTQARDQVEVVELLAPDSEAFDGFGRH